MTQEKVRAATGRKGKTGKRECDVLGPLAEGREPGQLTAAHSKSPSSQGDTVITLQEKQKENMSYTNFPQTLGC